jgi:phenylpropionate dioxygenase-like ring-hydroxylating dioxygenase large terminal subunit
VFVNPDPDAEPLAGALGDLPEVVAANGLDIEALEFRGRYPYELHANWKIAIENYLECYHCAVNHRASSTPSTTARCASRPGRHA